MPFPAGNSPAASSHAAECVNGDLDPFSDWVFREPRQPPFSVRELNDGALKRLLGRFDRLIAGPLPRPGRRLDQAQLVVSPQPGYGKSHLIGRLFAALAGRATLIYVTPFHSPSLCWQSILLRIVQELTLPDRRADGEAFTPLAPAEEEPTQLDAFAHGVLAHLAAGLIESGKAPHPDPAGAAAWLRENPLDAFMLADPGHPWSQWLREVFETFHRDMEGALRRAGLAMHSPGWLRVLFRYAASLPDDEARAHCLAWMSGQALEPDEAVQIGLRPGELTPAETPDQINELCWRRLLDFCQLAAFYRPFVFCFDQTEAYGHSPALARCFGMVIAQIHLMAAGEMMVVTANQQPWEETVARFMENADQDRFAPLPLEGIRRAQAEELVRRRCQQHGVPPAQLEAFMDPLWLAGRFPTERNRMGVRQFLQLCSARWQKSGEWWRSGAAIAAPGLPDAPELPLAGPAALPPVAAAASALPSGPAPGVAPVSRLPLVSVDLIPRIGAAPRLPAAEPTPPVIGAPPAVAVAPAAPVPVTAPVPAVEPAPAPAVALAPKIAAAAENAATPASPPASAPDAVTGRAAAPALSPAHSLYVAGRAPVAATLSLRELHDRYTEDLATQPKRLLYHPDTFRWLVAEVARGCAGLEIETQIEGARGCLPVAWRLDRPAQDGTPTLVLFGFEPGDNWKRWRSILREVQDRCLPPPLLPAGGQSAPVSKAVFLRTAEQTPIPGPGWEIGGELESARRTCFDVIELEAASVAELYAARALFLDAAAGDLPYSTPEVMAFLRNELEPLWERIQERMPGEPEPVYSDGVAAGVS